MYVMLSIVKIKTKTRIHRFFSHFIFYNLRLVSSLPSSPWPWLCKRAAALSRSFHRLAGGWTAAPPLLLFSRENSKKLSKFTFSIYIIGRRRDKNCQEKPLPLPRTIFCTVIFGSESRSGFQISLDPDPVSAAPGS